MGESRIAPTLASDFVTIKKIRLDLLVSMESNHSSCSIEQSAVQVITTITYQYLVLVEVDLHTPKSPK